MAVRIRLTRLGKKDKPSYRIVAIEKTNKRDGKVLEIIGVYDPTINPAKVSINNIRLKFWMDNGATTSNAVTQILHL